MVRYNLRYLIEKKSIKDGKKITYKDIESATGIGYFTLSRINSVVNYNLHVDHLEKLCNYFSCTPNDLISIYPDEKKM